MNCNEIDYSGVAANIPHVIQSLYNDDIFHSTSLIEIRDAFRINQMQGKAWLLKELNEVNRDKPILVIGSWMGFTSYCLYKMGFKYITETDPDSRLSLMAQHINQENKHFIHLNRDVNEISLDKYDLIINTSCEHIGVNDWFDRVPSGCLLALQSTNLKWHDHVNTVQNIDEMKSKYKFNYDYTGELQFNPTYSRFMLIGSKP